MKVKSDISVFKFKYNGKELDAMHGLNEYDYHARQMDPIIGQFNSMDPLCEKYYHISPYAYCAGNPVRYVDPDGEKIRIWYTNNGMQESVLYGGGTLNNSNWFVQSVISAYNYNRDNWIKSGNKGKSPLMELVENDKVEVNIMRTKLNTVYKPTVNTIYWNPKLGMELDNHKVLSPATGLDHEADHAVFRNLFPSQYEKGKNTTLPGWKNAEEKRVITGSEPKTAYANHEILKGGVTRKSHSSGRPVITKGAKSTFIVVDKTNAYIKEYENSQNWTSE